MKNVVMMAAMLCAAVLDCGADAPVTLMEQQMDSVAQSHHIIDIDGSMRGGGAVRDSVQHLIDAFYLDQFRHFQDPAAPYFLFMSKDAQLAMGIGGCVRMRGYFDWGGAIPASGFAPYLIEMNPSPLRRRKFGTTPAGSTLFFRVIGRNKSMGDYQLYIEANFNGYQGRDFHLKKAYASINEVVVGYASSTFSDPAALPPTVDAQGPANKISPTNVLVRWCHSFKERWRVALSLETPATAVGAVDTTVAKVDEWMPDVAAFLQYQWSRSQHVRVAGILRTLSYRDMVAGRNCNVAGWGVLASAVVSPHPAVTIYSTFNVGRGIGSMGGDLQIGRYDLVPAPGRAGAMYAPWSLGWNVAVQYNFRPDIFVSASFSQSRYMPRRPVAGDEYKVGQVFSLNAFWHLTPRIQAGVEFDMGSRRNMDGCHRRAQRVGAVAQFSF